ncbi:uncharacterized protein M421DRAFT_270754 [Didymella exigua CBS 183.55]|uniref:Uncharacterized protein n=1 Tax=Didymella exigua CBS 183.55 TaxID=1150837 RepID=A0A6A5RAX6_9PLEO|nr:uncharacterized protein M421DRAFT_270754 [Didymella exigua CBS 183.55]KAF1924782.1 hypothetical protein M421DRAFT_270754 [Didymella exigua CBS 183.55]
MDGWLAHTFLELRWEHVPRDCFAPKIRLSADKSELFEIDFEFHAVRAAVWLATTVLETHAVRVQTSTVECELGTAEDEGIATDDCIWQPCYVVRFRDFGGVPEARLIGHVEFLAGRSGALTEAYKLRKTAKYGSLRCVLGDLVQWMLMNNHRYAFLVSSDEIMYLRMDVEEIKEKDKIVFRQPRLHYSEPMKITDAFDAEKETISVRMGLLYLFWSIIQDGENWKLPEEMGNCLNYAAFTQGEEDLKVKAPCVPEPLKKDG